MTVKQMLGEKVEESLKKKARLQQNPLPTPRQRALRCPAKLQRRLEESESDESQTFQPDPSQPSEPKASRPAPTGSEQPHKKNNDEIFLAPTVFTLTPRQVQNLNLAGALFLCYGSGALRVGAGLYQRPEASGHEDSRI